MPLNSSRLEDDSALTCSNTTLEVMPFFSRLSVIADMVVYSCRTPEQLVFVGTRLQGALDAAEGLAVAPHVLLDLPQMRFVMEPKIPVVQGTMRVH